MLLRDYQEKAINSLKVTLREHKSALVVMPTGTGKTIVFAKAVQLAKKRALVIAHRDILVHQAADKIHTVTGQRPAIEMADLQSDEKSFFNRSKVVVASVQTLNAGSYRRRMDRFRPEDFSLLVVDEAHHACAPSYRRVIEKFAKAGCKIIGVSATPDRADELALGQVFDSVAFKYEMSDAIDDGWLVPLDVHRVYVKSLDFSACRNVGSDFNQGDLGRIMEEEKNLHGVVVPTMEIAGDKKTVIFATRVAHAERMAEIINRTKPGSAATIEGKMPKDLRQKIIRDYVSGKIQYLVNVGIATEGFDVPGIACVVMARPTQSRSLYAQCCGRGTRPLTGILDGIEDPALRRQAIADSDKAKLTVIDFVGNAGRHSLMCAKDVLGGKHVDWTEHGQPVIPADDSGYAQDHPDYEEDEPAPDYEDLNQDAENETRKKRKGIRATVEYELRSSDPFQVLSIKSKRFSDWYKRRLSEKQLGMLRRAGINPESHNPAEQCALFDSVVKRRKENLCTFKQAKLLNKFGVDGSAMTFREASDQIDRLINKKR
jgi:superfamily II DNA or RNA helicase